MSIKFKKQTFLSKIGDLLMLPVMYILQFPSFETPQRTHYWNNVKSSVADIKHFDPHQMVSVSSDLNAVKRWLGPLPIFHMPVFGGWKKFVVLQPVVDQDEWYVGWIVGDTMGISQIKLDSKVRLLKGPTPVSFFGVNENGDQININLVAEGVLGKKHSYRNIILL